MPRNGLYPPSVTPGIPKLGEKPDGWILTTFGEALKVVKRNANIVDDAEYQLVTAKRSRGGIVPREKLLGKQIKTKTQFFIAANDFLISRRQIIHGACGVVPPDLDGALVSNEYATLRVKRGLLLEFLDHFTHTVYFQQTCFHASVGVDVEKMIFKLDDWLKYKVYLPPLPEQRAIAAILGTWDRVIALTERRLAAAEQRKKALMQRLLTGRVRFPEFVKSAEKQNSKYGDLPADWKTIRLESVAEVNAESIGESSKPNRKYLYIDLSSVDRGTITIPTEHQAFVDLPSRARRILHKGDVIMATVRPNLLGFAICDFEPENTLCSTGFALISPKDLQDSQFIYQSLYSDMILKQVYGLVTGSNYPAINASEVKRLWFVWPASVEERQKIAAILNACDREVDLLRRKRDALQEQKQGLMQRLLTGRVRVRDGEA